MKKTLWFLIILFLLIGVVVAVNSDKLKEKSREYKTYIPKDNGIDTKIIYNNSVLPQANNINSIYKINESYIITFGSNYTILGFDEKSEKIPKKAIILDIRISPINKIVNDLNNPRKFVVYVNRNCFANLSKDGGVCSFE